MTPGRRGRFWPRLDLPAARGPNYARWPLPVTRHRATHGEGRERMGVDRPCSIAEDAGCLWQLAALTSRGRIGQGMAT